MLAFNHLGHLGRLGNQMFQYASLRGIAANRGYDFGIPDSDGSNEWAEHQLFQVFDLVGLNRRNVGYLDGGHAPIAKEVTFTFDELLFNQCPNDVSLWGFFQTEKYFKHIEQEIRRDFTFRPEILNPCAEFMEENPDCISLHVRRTDYIPNKANHYNLGLDYYKKALDRFPTHRKVLVFSDDTDWCKEQELFSSDRFMISESGYNAADMCLMTFCTSHIIANSSFSWWGAWLSGSKDVIAPVKWFGPNNLDKSTSDLIPLHWQLIDSK
jgi:hypothetical protein